MLEKWANVVKVEIRKVYAGGNNWDPVAAAVELLALGIHQSGRNAIEAKVDSLILKVWEAKEPEMMACFTPNWGQVNKKVLQNWTKLQGILRVLCSGTKGGVAGNYVNPVAVTRAVRSLRQRSLKLSQEPPLESKISSLKTLADIYREVKERYLTDLEAERNAWCLWKDKLNDALGPDVTLTQLLVGLREAIVHFENAGLAGGSVLVQLKKAMEELNLTVAERTREAVKKLESENATSALLRIAIAARSREFIDELTSKADSFLSNAESAVKNRRAEEAQKVGPGLTQSRETITRALEGLVSASNKIQLATESDV
jgi:hypothetical protein